VGIVLLLTSTAQPAAASDKGSVPPKPVPGSVSVSPVQSSPVTDDCAAVRAQLPDLARRAATTGKTSVACIEPTRSTAGKTREPGPSTLLEPFPDWCNDHPGSWSYDMEVGREQACSYRDVTLTVTNINTGAVIGQIYFDEYSLAFTSSSIPTFGYQVQLDMYGGWGAIGGTFVQGSASCSGACTLNSSDFPPQAVTLTSLPDGEAFFRSTATARGSVGNANAAWSYFFTNATWAAPSTPVAQQALTVRCDHNLPGNNTVAGCVVRDVAGTMFYSVSGAYEELAWHILDAQNSGLAGSHPAYELPNPAPLNRLVDAAQQTANYNRSCPSSYPRPAGLSCDEYPFQSSRQGASTGGGPGRTFPGCQVPLPSGTGPSGYSACMIDATENSEGGSALGSFYVDQRILDNDAYYVWITP